MAFGQGGSGNQGNQRRYGNSGDPERGQQGGQRPRGVWDDFSRQALQRLLKDERARLNDSTREMLEKYANERNPTNNMKCVVFKIYCEKFHRPNKDYVIQAWQPDGPQGGGGGQQQPAQGEQPRQQANSERPERGGQPQQRQQRQRPQNADSQQERPAFGQDRWGDGGGGDDPDAGGQD